MSQNIVDLSVAKAQQRVKRKKCPNCGGVALPKYHPFCSVRCVQLDLGHWLNEDYRVPVIDYDDQSETNLPDGD